MTAVVVAKSFLDAAGRFDTGDRGRVFDFLSRFFTNPANPGLCVERVARARAEGLWSARVTEGLRAIFHQEVDTYTLLWVDAHDPAYDWAGRRRAGRNSRTGELQVMVVPELIQEAIRRPPPAQAPEKAPLLAAFSDEYLLSIGFTEDWLPTLRQIRSDEQLEVVSRGLPEELSERLFRLALGEVVTPPPPPPPVTPTPDPAGVEASAAAQHRYWVIRNAGEIDELRDKPIEIWIRYLHPSQKDIVERVWSGPAEVTGAAGTGKTVVAMHRARHLARQGKTVLLTSFVTTLCKNLDRALKVLCSVEEKRRITVSNVDSIAMDLLGSASPRNGFATDDEIRKAISDLAFYAARVGDADFLIAEWERFVQVKGLLTWPEYRDAPRKGRGKALSAIDRKTVWEVFQRVFERLERSGKLPSFAILRKAEEAVTSGRITPAWDAVIVDEVQDLSAPSLRLLAALSRRAPENFLLVGDGGQRIYRSTFSLKSVGIDVVGRSRVLKLNYRNTRQIQGAADLVLKGGADDLDDGIEDRKGTLSPLGGPEPVFRGFETSEEHDEFLADSIKKLLGQGLSPREIAVFARTGDLVRSVTQALRRAGIESEPLERETDLAAVKGVNAGTMHRAKGLEFKAVFLAHVSEGAVPSPGLLRRAVDPVDREMVLDRERNLVYVALTRARDEAFVLWTGRPSPFLEPVLEKKEASSG